MSRDIKHLHRIMRPWVSTFIDLTWRRIGVRLKNVETWRDNSAQLVHYGKGRDEEGNVIDRSAVVTWVKPGFSYHNLTMRDGTPASLAIHLVPELPEGRLLGYGTSKLDRAALLVYEAVGVIGTEIGGRWGGDWDQDGKLMEPGEDDLGHWEFHPGFDIRQARAALAAGKDLASLVVRT